MKKTKQLISFICSLLLIFSTINYSIFADNTTLNSTPSTNTNTIDGEDLTQGEQTTYNNGTNFDTNEETKVYVSQSSNFAAMIPKVIILDGHGGNATYEVYAKGNIGGTENVYIIPQDTFQLNDVKNIKSSLNGTIVQPKTTFSWNDVMNEQKSTSIGNILVNNISAGNWSGCFNFNIYLKDTSIHTNGIYLLDGSIVNDETNAIQIQSSSNKVIPISIYPANSIDELKISSSSPYVTASLEEIEVSPIASANIFFDSLLLTNNVFAENENSKTINLLVNIKDNAPCDLNATITLKARNILLNIPILIEHSYDNGIITQEPNCVTNGTKIYTCVKCNHIIQEEIRTIGHNYVNGICSICNKDLNSTLLYSNNIQTYTIEETGYYTISAFGSKGGDYASYTGGLGGSIDGRMLLNKGQVIKVSTGNIGTNLSGISETNGANGGGKTEVYLDDTLIMVAAGGGGANILNNGGNGGINITTGQTTPNGGIGIGGGGSGYIGGNAGTYNRIASQKEYLTFPSFTTIYIKMNRYAGSDSGPAGSGWWHYSIGSTYGIIGTFNYGGYTWTTDSTDMQMFKTNYGATSTSVPLRYVPSANGFAMWVDGISNSIGTSGTNGYFKAFRMTPETISSTPSQGGLNWNSNILENSTFDSKSGTNNDLGKVIISAIEIS